MRKERKRKDGVEETIKKKRRKRTYVFKGETQQHVLVDERSFYGLRTFGFFGDVLEPHKNNNKPTKCYAL